MSAGRALGPAFPFSALVAADELRLALVLAAVDPGIGGVLLRGEKGSAKTTAARGLAALLAGIAALVIVSLATRPEPAEKIASFFDRLGTSSDDERRAPLLIVDLLRLRRRAGGSICRTYREDLGGVLAGSS